MQGASKGSRGAPQINLSNSVAPPGAYAPQTTKAGANPTMSQ